MIHNTAWFTSKTASWNEIVTVAILAISHFNQDSDEHFVGFNWILTFPSGQHSLMGIWGFYLHENMSQNSEICFSTFSVAARSGMPCNSHVVCSDSDRSALSLLISFALQGPIYQLRYLKYLQHVIFFPGWLYLLQFQEFVLWDLLRLSHCCFHALVTEMGILCSVN